MPDLNNNSIGLKQQLDSNVNKDYIIKYKTKFSSKSNIDLNDKNVLIFNTNSEQNIVELNDEDQQALETYFIDKQNNITNIDLDSSLEHQKIKKLDISDYQVTNSNDFIVKTNSSIDQSNLNIELCINSEDIRVETDQDLEFVVQEDVVACSKPQLLNKVAKLKKQALFLESNNITHHVGLTFEPLVSKSQLNSISIDKSVVNSLSNNNDQVISDFNIDSVNSLNQTLVNEEPKVATDITTDQYKHSQSNLSEDYTNNNFNYNTKESSVIPQIVSSENNINSNNDFNKVDQIIDNHFKHIGSDIENNESVVYTKVELLINGPETFAISSQQQAHNIVKNVLSQSEDSKLSLKIEDIASDPQYNSDMSTEQNKYKPYTYFNGETRNVKLSKYYPEYIYDNDDLFKDQPVLLEGKNLCKDYTIKQGLFKKTIVHSVKNANFVLHEGETLSIVGESGSGKTTLAKILTAIEQQTYGDIYYRGELIKRDKKRSAELRRSIQIIFQNPHSSLNPRKSIYKILEEPLKLNTKLSSKERKQKIEEIIQLVGLNKNQLSRLPHMFSGGQKQRIAIARGLILNPSIVVADEAVSALDVSVQAQILNLMLELQKLYNLSYVFISHDLSVVKHISHKIMVMYHGEIVEYGTVDQIFNNPQHPYTKSLLNAIPKLPKCTIVTPCN